ncbi:hypothetical protein P0D69_38840 [Paraburkholderia sediminicola]|uniref:hypothetical protein n=1 Tax=Paraburkholderia sediminicola TaxID=458836 RepID=UPI0038B7455E
MRNMQAIHEKMMAAKTPQEHAALMGEQMKAVQDGMAMMDKMKQDSSGHTISPENARDDGKASRHDANDDEVDDGPASR